MSKPDSCTATTSVGNDDLDRFRTAVVPASVGSRSRRIKAAANARDVPYQSLIKVWLEEKLSA